MLLSHPNLRFKLTVHKITNTNLTKLHWHFLWHCFHRCHISMWRKQLQMPPWGTLAIMHTTKGLTIKSLSPPYKETHAASHATSWIKQVNVALDSRLTKKQWTRKGSITWESGPYICDICESNVKESVNEEVQAIWHDHIKALTVQGCFLELLHMKKTHLTWRSIIFNLPCWMPALILQLKTLGERNSA